MQFRPLVRGSVAMWLAFTAPSIVFACGAFGSEDDEPVAPDDPPDALARADSAGSADSTTAIEAGHDPETGSDSGSTFCTQRPASYLCEDFDRGVPPVGWSRNGPGGTVSYVPASDGGSGALHISTPDNRDGSGTIYAAINHDVTPPPAFSQLELEFAFRFVTDPGPAVSSSLVVMSLGAAGPLALLANGQTAGTTFALAGDGLGNPRVKWPVPSLTVGTWYTFRFVVKQAPAAATVDLYVDGNLVDAGAPTQMARVGADPMSLDLRIASQKGSNAIEIELDNVLVSFIE